MGYGSALPHTKEATCVKPPHQHSSHNHQASLGLGLLSTPQAAHSIPLIFGRRRYTPRHHHSLRVHHTTPNTHAACTSILSSRRYHAYNISAGALTAAAQNCHSINNSPILSLVSSHENATKTRALKPVDSCKGWCYSPQSAAHEPFGHATKQWGQSTLT